MVLICLSIVINAEGRRTEDTEDTDGIIFGVFPDVLQRHVFSGNRTPCPVAGHER